jgi:hypothetical protein
VSTKPAAGHGTVREVVRKALAWADIVSDGRLQQQMTKSQAADAVDKAKTSKDGALKATRSAWAHVLYPEKHASSVTGSAFSLEHLSIVAKERGPIPAAVYDKLKADGIAKERLGPDALWLHLKPFWLDDRPHLAVSELADWFSSYVYLPKIRDRVVLDAAIRDAVGKLDAAFAYADDVDATTGQYSGLALARTPPDIFPATALVVRADVAGKQIAETLKPAPSGNGTTTATGAGHTTTGAVSVPAKPSGPKKPKRFYGTVELDMVRPVKAFDAVLNAVVMELQRPKGAKVKITVEIEAEAPDGFDDGDVGVVRDNARQLKFKADSTGFSDE